MTSHKRNHDKELTLNKEPAKKKQRRPSRESRSGHRVLDLHHIGSQCTDLESLLEQQQQKCVSIKNEETTYDQLLLQQNFLKSARFDVVLHVQRSPKWSALLCQLSTITLTTNALEEFPQGIELLASSLRHLYLANNRIKELPQSVSLLHNLETLDLRNNCIQRIERATVKGLAKLAWLSLSNNEMTTVNDLPPLPSLTFLGLFGNKISNREETVSVLRTRFTSLRTLTIAGNEQMYRAPAMRGQACDFKRDLVRALPKLQWLDSHFITDKERQSFQNQTTPHR